METKEIIDLITEEQVHSILHGLEEKHNLCVIIWSPEDVIERAKENDIIVSQEDAEYILQRVSSDHDCNYGVSWETLDCYIDGV